MSLRLRNNFLHFLKRHFDWLDLLRVTKRTLNFGWRLHLKSFDYSRYWTFRDLAKLTKIWREPCSSAMGGHLYSRSLWVQIQAPFTWWTFFTFICYRNCNVCLKRWKSNEKEAEDGPFFKKIVEDFDRSYTSCLHYFKCLQI